MEDGKLNETIKIMELCTSPHCTCEGCPRRPTDDKTDCGNDLMKDALELLKDYRQHLQNDLEALKKEMASCEFVMAYKQADTIREKIMCFIAKLTHGNVVTPLGRIVLLPEDYDKLTQ